MVSLYSLIIFFFLLVICFSAVALAATLAGWWRKRQIGRHQIGAHEKRRAIDADIDRIKSRAFGITAGLVLFGLTPFVILYFLVFN